MTAEEQVKILLDELFGDYKRDVDMGFIYPNKEGECSYWRRIEKKYIV